MQGGLRRPIGRVKLPCMTITPKDPSELNERQALNHLRKLGEDVDLANVMLGDYLLALEGSAHWQTISWADLAASLGVTRQAVQQRVARLLADGTRRRARTLAVDPNQLTIPLTPERDIADLPPTRGRKR